jgi:hypothetical protein
MRACTTSMGSRSTSSIFLLSSSFILSKTRVLNAEESGACSLTSLMAVQVYRELAKDGLESPVQRHSSAVGVATSRVRRDTCCNYRPEVKLTMVKFLISLALIWPIRMVQFQRLANSWSQAVKWKVFSPQKIS